MVRVSDGIMPSEAIEMLCGPLESLSFIQLCLLGFGVLGVAAHRGMDAVIEVVFVRLLRSVLAGEQRMSERGKERQDTAETRETRESGYGFAVKEKAWEVVAPEVYVGDSMSAEDHFRRPRAGQRYRRTGDTKKSMLCDEVTGQGCTLHGRSVNNK